MVRGSFELRQTRNRKGIPVRLIRSIVAATATFAGVVGFSGIANAFTVTNLSDAPASAAFPLLVSWQYPLDYVRLGGCSWADGACHTNVGASSDAICGSGLLRFAPSSESPDEYGPCQV